MRVLVVLTEQVPVLAGGGQHHGVGVEGADAGGIDGDRTAQRIHGFREEVVEAEAGVRPAVDFAAPPRGGQARSAIMFLSCTDVYPTKLGSSTRRTPVGS